MSSLSYCVLLPKPFQYCQSCARNLTHAESSWKMKFKSPAIDKQCMDFINLKDIKDNDKNSDSTEPEI